MSCRASAREFSPVDPANSTPHGPACECRVVRPAALDSRWLAVHAPAPLLHAKLAQLLRGEDLPHTTQGDAFIVAAEAGPLTRLLGRFTSSEQPGLLAMPWDGERFDPWKVAPFAQWVHRLSTPWFAHACEQLRFYAQPIVALGDGGLYGYEALVRAQGEGGDLIGAGELLGAAAAHGQARAFDAHARITAIRQIVPQLAGAQMLFINFSPSVVYTPSVCLKTTFAACAEVGASFGQLVFEVTETEAFPDLNLLRAILERYRAEGAQVALDDLGAGHTSLTYLTELRPDIVKLDRALIRALHGDDPRLPLVSSLIRYAHDLGIRVVAEGVETPAELALVRALGADYAQGYLLGRPAPHLSGLSAQVAAYWAPAQG